MGRHPSKVSDRKEGIFQQSNQEPKGSFQNDCTTTMLHCVDTVWDGLRVMSSIVFLPYIAFCGMTKKLHFVLIDQNHLFPHVCIVSNVFFISQTPTLISCITILPSSLD